jgi:mannose-6-phosphate isomerase-like protein (cupin superfamily)
MVAIAGAAAAVAWLPVPAVRVAAQDAPANARIQSTDPAKYRPLTAVHAGAGNMAFMALLGRGAITPHFNFLHRGEIPAGSGIGHHFHNVADEMFVILNGEAQFTVDGRTSLVKGPVAVVCRAGHSHALYNSGTETLQWMNWQVTVQPNISDAFDLGDARVGVPLDPIPVFMTAKLDRALARPAEEGVTSRRLYQPPVFASPWTYVDHVLVAPKGQTKTKAHDTVAEVYYVVAGAGVVKTSGSRPAPNPPGATVIGGNVASIKTGDAVPIQLGEESHFENAGSEPLELLVIGVAKDHEAKSAFSLAAAPRRP